MSRIENGLPNSDHWNRQNFATQWPGQGPDWVNRYWSAVTGWLTFSLAFGAALPTCLERPTASVNEVARLTLFPKAERAPIDMDVTGSPRILITRLSHIGDCVLTLPVLTTLRKALPDAFIAWAVESPSNQLLDLHPDLDKTILIPKGWAGKPRQWRELSSTLKAYRFDVVIDPQGITKSSALGWISGAKKRIGLRGRWGRELSKWLNNHLVETRSPHIVERSIELLEAMGIPAPSKTEIRYGLPVCPESQSSLQLKMPNKPAAQQFALINPGGFWPSKRWELDRFGSVASYLKRHHDLPCVIVWAGDEELEMARAIHEFDRSASFIAPQTNLRELAVLAHQARFCIAGDTGPKHIAAAMGTPCIGLYGTTNPVDSGAFGPHHIIVQKWYQSGSTRKRRKASNDAMRDILASDVFSACDQMIEALNREQKSVA